jgi:hypothetical protein
MNSSPVLCGTNRERTAIFPEHMNSPPVLCGVCFAQSNIMCSVLYIIVFPFVLFPLAIVCLSLIFTVSGYPPLISFVFFLLAIVAEKKGQKEKQLCTKHYT